MKRQGQMADGQALNWRRTSRRRPPRYEVNLPLDVTVLRSGIPDKVPGRSVNLSERGVAAVLAAELVTGEAVGVELRLPERAQPLRWRAVVRHQDKLRCGMEFAGLSGEEKAAIRHCTEKLKATPEPVTALPSPAVIETQAAAPAKDDKDHREKVTADKTLKNKNSDLEDSSPKEIPDGPGRRVMLWQILVATCAILLGVFWWRWNRGWDDLESGLPNQQQAMVENPQLEVPAEEMEKLVIHRVDPEYPAEARQANLESVIALDVIVGKDGSVISVRPLNGPEVLARPAANAMRWWKFEPYQVNGTPRVIETTLAVEFKP